MNYWSLRNLILNKGILFIYFMLINILLVFNLFLCYIIIYFNDNDFGFILYLVCIIRIFKN